MNNNTKMKLIIVKNCGHPLNQRDQFSLKNCRTRGRNAKSRHSTKWKWIPFLSGVQKKKGRKNNSRHRPPVYVIHYTSSGERIIRSTVAFGVPNVQVSSVTFVIIIVAYYCYRRSSYIDREKREWEREKAIKAEKGKKSRARKMSFGPFHRRTPPSRLSLQQCRAHN